jgi:molecular chaperone DnaJ
MTWSHDLYGLLEVAPDADPDEIKRAYRLRARQLHPARNPGDPAAAEGFGQVREAYRILSDPALRAEYDRRRTDGSAPAAGRGLKAWLRKVFGGEGLGPEPGDDLQTRLSVGLAELVAGATIRFDLPTSRACRGCRGQGLLPALREEPAETCRACGGSGRLPHKVRIEVQVPPGAEDGTRLKIDGEGEPGLRGGRDGDLYVVVEVTPHPLLERTGQRLSCELPVPLPLALAGGEAIVPGPSGRLTVQIPAGIQSGASLKLAGQGLPPAGGGPRGDLLVEVQIELPRGLDPDQRAALQAALKSLDPEHYPRTVRFKEDLDAAVGPDRSA